MKKLLLSFLTLVVAAVCGISASAQTTYSTIVKWSEPGTIVIKKGTSYTSATDVVIPEGATEINLTEGTYYYVLAADGYAIESGDLGGSNLALSPMGSYDSGVFGFSVRPNIPKFNGKTLTVNVVKLEYKAFNLEVANGASALTFQYYKDGSLVSKLSDVVDGSNDLQFPSNANQLYIQMSSLPREKLYSVKLGGVEQELANTLQYYYLVPLTEGCEIYVAKDDPATAQNFEVTFTFTNNNPNIVNTVFDWSLGAFISPDVFGAVGYKLTVPNNGDIQFNWNPEATITGLTQNGTAVPIKDGNNRVTITENTNFVITGTMTEYEQKTVQLYLTDAENVSFTANGEEFVPTYVEDVPQGTSLPSGFVTPVATKLYEGTVEAKENAGVSFEVNSGYYIKQAARGTLAGAFTTQEDIDFAGSTSKINLENMPLYLDVAKINYSATAWVYYEGPESTTAVLSCPTEYQGANNLAQGWNKITFDPDYNTSFSARVNATAEHENWVMTAELDGTALTADENGMFSMPAAGSTTGKVVNNSVIKLFFAATAVAPYVTTFETSATKDAEISYDKCKTVDLTSTTEVTNFGATPYVIKPGEGVIVKVDGVEQTPNSEGIVEYTATKASTITLDVPRVEPAEPGTLNPASGATVRRISMIRYTLPFTEELGINFDGEKISEITLTSTVEGAEPITPEFVEQVGGDETSVDIGISFPEITEAGEYTLNIPAGFFYQTKYEEGSFDYVYYRDFAACTATYTVDPNKPFEYSFDPANGSDNELPTSYGLAIKINGDANSLEPVEGSVAGPWVKYNGVDIPKVDDADASEEEGVAAWSWDETYDIATMKLVKALYLNQSVFKVAGTLEITADEGALLIDGETPSPAFTYSANFGDREMAEPGTLNPASGATVRRISMIRYTLPFTEELGINFDREKISEITLTSTVEGAEPITPEFVEQVGGDETSVDIGISFPEITEAGEYTLNIPAGFFYQTKYEEGSFDYVYYRDFAACTATYTVDPNKPFEYSFDPANGSDNELPTSYGLAIKINGDANSLEPVEGSVAGPWVKYNGVDIRKVETSEDADAADANGEAAWSWDETYDIATMKLVKALYLNQSVFKVAGTLEITADEGALLIDGETPSPAFTYSANFGEKKVYTATFDPAPGSTVPAVKPVISFTLDGATKMAVNPDGFDAYFRKGMMEGVQISETQITIEGNKLTYTAENEDAFSPGNYTFVISEGSLIIDDSQLNDDISATYVIERTTAPSQDWTANPDGAVVNAGYGMNVAFIFGEEESVARGEKFSEIKVEFDGVALAPYNSSTPAVEGYQVAMESSMPNALMINVMGGKFNDASTEGKLTVTLPAGSVNISGTPLAEDAVYTWALVPEKTYTITANPASGSTVKELTKISLSFPEAKTVALSETFRLSKISVYQGYSWIGEALSATPVEGAEVPTIDITIAPISEAGEFEIRISYDTFAIDSYYTNGNVTFEYTVDPAMTGIEGIAADNGLYTVVSLQGIVLMKDVEAAALDTLPAGLYIINGTKIYLRK